jgi:type I restriction enzyme S subunit
MAQAIFKSWFVDFEPSGGEMPGDWQSGTLGNICSYGTKRISIDELTAQTYISTENMLQNRGGFVDASSLPAISKTTGFEPGNVLVSNIRPYFKKIVFCAFTGGCSTDVLCFQAREKVFTPYLYYLLFHDAFFDYMVAGSKGTKMPRGDKWQIMNYPIVIPTNDVLGDFTGLVTQTLSKTAANNDENRCLAALRDALLPKLMSGEITIDIASKTRYNDNK